MEENAEMKESGAEQKQEAVQEQQKQEKTFTQYEVNAILAKERSKMQKTVEAKVSEAEKLAQMNAEEKANYTAEQKTKELSDREAAITRRELAAEAKVTLSEKGLPSTLADVLDYTDADKCNQSIAVIEKAFKKAVEKGIQERLKGGEPPKKAPQTEVVTKEQFSKMGYEERYKLKTEQPELFKQLTGK